MSETWRYVKGYEGMYCVSDLGRVLSLTRSDSKGRRVQARILKQYMRTPYWTVMLHADDKGIRHTVHTLVLTAFKGEAPEGHECCHRDGCHTNNHLDNLMWGTHSINGRQMTMHGTQHLIKLTPEIVSLIRQEHCNNYGDGARLARLFGVSRSTVCDIIKGKTWKDVTL